ncbi:MAG TPA: hypothetical protein VMX56_06170 [Anaerolineales bacterium]|nr:hypothetical protein [Anaerolineales bacterium]
MSLTWEKFLADPQKKSKGIHLLELQPLLRLTGWTATEDKINVYELPFANTWGPQKSYRNIAAVSEDAKLMTEVGSVDAVENTSGSWYWDEANGVLYQQGWGGHPDQENRAVVVEPVLRFSTHSPQPAVFNGHLYEPLIEPRYVPKTHLAGIDFLEGNNLPQFGGDLVLNNRSRIFDELCYRASLRGGRAKLLFGGIGMDYADFRAVLTGHIDEEPLVGDESVKLVVAPLAAALDELVPINTIPPNSGYLADAVGKTMPVLLGRVEGQEPLKILSKDADYVCHFNGSNYAKRANASLVGLKFDQSLTFGGIFYCETLSTPRAILSCWTGSGNLKSYLLFIGPYGRMYLYLSPDGNNAYYMRTTPGTIKAKREYQFLTAYNVDEQQGIILLDGVPMQIETAGNAPLAIYVAGTADFILGAYDAGTNSPHLGYLREIWAAAGAHTSMPNDLTLLKGLWRFENGLQDLSGNGNHLIQVGGLNESAFENTGGTNPVRNMIRLNDGVSDEMASCAKASLADNLQDGFVFQFRLRFRTSAMLFFGKIHFSGSNWQFVFSRSDIGRIYVYLSSDGTTWAWTGRSTFAVAENELAMIKIAYHGATQNCKLYINTIESTYTQSGAVPASLFASVKDLEFGISSTGVGYAVDFEEIAISNVHASQFNGDEITGLIHRWRFQPENIYTSGGIVYIADDFGGCPLELTNCGMENIKYCEGGDVYQVADRFIQQIQTPERVFTEESGKETDLDEGEDYEIDYEECRITIINPDISSIKFTGEGALIGDIPGGFADRDEAETCSRAVDQILFLLRSVKGFPADFVDLESFAAARIGSKRTGLYLTERTSLSQLIYRLCVSDTLMPVIAEKFALRRYVPSLNGAVSISTEDLKDFAHVGEDESVLYQVIINYGFADRQAQTTNSSAPAIFGIDETREIDSALIYEEDAQALAHRLAFLAKNRPLRVEFDALDLRLSCALPGDTILVTRDRAAGPDGKLDAYPLTIVEIEANNAKGTVHVVADDWRGALRESALFVESGYPDYSAASEMERIKGGFVKTDTAAQTEGQLFF